MEIITICHGGGSWAAGAGAGRRRSLERIRSSVGRATRSITTSSPGPGPHAAPGSPPSRSSRFVRPMARTSPQRRVSISPAAHSNHPPSTTRSNASRRSDRCTRFLSDRAGAVAACLASRTTTWSARSVARSPKRPPSPAPRPLPEPRRSPRSRHAPLSAVTAMPTSIGRRTRRTRHGTNEVLADLPQIPQQPQPHERHRQSHPHPGEATLKTLTVSGRA